MQKRTQSNDDDNDVIEQAEAERDDPGVDVVGEVLGAMQVEPIAWKSRANLKHRTARLKARARCAVCVPYDASRPAHKQAPRCGRCLLQRAMRRRSRCCKCHKSLDAALERVYRVERTVAAWRTKLGPRARKVNRDHNAVNSLRVIVATAASNNNKRPVEYTFGGNK